MKHLLVLAVFCCFFLIGILGQNIAQAEEAPSGEKSAVEQVAGSLPQEDIQVLKEILSLFKEGKEVNQTQTGTKSKPTTQEIVDKYLGKAFDVVGIYASKAEGIIKKAAPELWAILVRQQYAEAFAKLAIPWFLALVLVIYMLAAGKWWRPETNTNPKIKTDEENAKYWCVGVLPTFVLLVIAVVGVFFTVSAIKVFVNPQFYAIKTLIEFIAGTT